MNIKVDSKHLFLVINDQDVSLSTIMMRDVLFSFSFDVKERGNKNNLLQRNVKHQTNDIFALFLSYHIERGRKESDKKATERRNIVFSHNSLRIQPFLFS